MSFGLAAVDCCAAATAAASPQPGGRRRGRCVRAVSHPNLLRPARSPPVPVRMAGTGMGRRPALEGAGLVRHYRAVVKAEGLRAGLRLCRRARRQILPRLRRSVQLLWARVERPHEGHAHRLAAPPVDNRILVVVVQIARSTALDRPLALAVSRPRAPRRPGPYCRWTPAPGCDASDADDLRLLARAEEADDLVRGKEQDDRFYGDSREQRRDHGVTGGRLAAEQTAAEQIAREAEARVWQQVGAEESAWLAAWRGRLECRHRFDP